MVNGPLHKLLKSYLKPFTIVALVFAAFLSGCGQEKIAKKETPNQLTNNPQHRLQRVVTLGVAISEIVHDLDCGANVVAVDTSTTTIEDYDHLPRVGYYRNFSAEGVLALRPTLVIASSQAGPQAALQKLKESLVPVMIIDEVDEIYAVVNKIRSISQILGCPEKADSLVEKFLDDLGTTPQLTDQSPRVLFLMSPPGVGHWLAAGEHTIAQKIIEAAGGRNAVNGFDGYKSLSREILAQLNPDLIVLPRESLKRAGDIASVLDQLGFPLDSPARNAVIYEVNMAEFLSAGSRLGRSVLHLRLQLKESGKSQGISENQSVGVP